MGILLVPDDDCSRNVLWQVWVWQGETDRWADPPGIEPHPAPPPPWPGGCSACGRQCSGAPGWSGSCAPPSLPQSTPGPPAQTPSYPRQTHSSGACGLPALLHPAVSWGQTEQAEANIPTLGTERAGESQHTKVGDRKSRLKPTHQMWGQTEQTEANTPNVGTDRADWSQHTKAGDRQSRLKPTHQSWGQTEQTEANTPKVVFKFLHILSPADLFTLKYR